MAVAASRGASKTLRTCSPTMPLVRVRVRGLGSG